MVVSIRYRKVNKLIWPAPGGIGMHQLQEMESVQRGALQFGLINRTVILICPHLLAHLLAPVPTYV